MLAIRTLKKTDLPALHSLYLDLLDHPTNYAKMEERFAWMSTNPDYLVLGAWLEDQLTGSLMAIFCQDLVGDCRPFMVLENVVVAASNRRSGVGRKLMETIEQTARERNCYYAMFCSNAHRLEAHAFYESLGYGPDVCKGFKKYL